MARATAFLTLSRYSPPQRRNCAWAALLSMRMAMRMVLKSVEGLVEMAGVTARRRRYQGQQARALQRIAAHRGRHKAAQLRQGVVEDVRQAVPVIDQVLDGVKPAAVVVGT